jgi:hypothetical protein
VEWAPIVWRLGWVKAWVSVPAVPCAPGRVTRATGTSASRSPGATGSRSSGRRGSASPRRRNPSEDGRVASDEASACDATDTSTPEASMPVVEGADRAGRSRPTSVDRERGPPERRAGVVAATGRVGREAVAAAWVWDCEVTVTSCREDRHNARAVRASRERGHAGLRRDGDRAMARCPARRRAPMAARRC